MNELYFMDSDDSGHWYVIPAARRKEWELWLESDGEDAWDAPSFAEAVNGSPSRVTFEAPVI